MGAQALPGDRLDFRLLGPLEVWRKGRPLHLGGKRQRALLALLLLHANEVVSSDLLIDELFGAQASETAANSLQAAVSRLRRALGDSEGARVLVTRSPGYAIEAAREQFDLTRFEQLLAQGRETLASGDPRGASETFGEALELWRGEPLADLGSHEFAERERRRLAELRLAGIMERVDADLALGLQAELVGELEALAVEHPYSERLRSQLMLALYRSGRQADALEAYREARRLLVDELGIEPGRELRDLQLAILEQRPALDLIPHLEPVADPHPQAELLAPPPSIAEASTRPSRKTVSVVHVRVSAHSADVADDDEIDPEVLRHIFARAMREVTVAIESNEGQIDTVSTDSVSAIFGLPAVHEDDPLRAVNAAEDIRSRLLRVAGELEHASMRGIEVRIGVSTGEVVAGGASAHGLGATGAPLATSSKLAQEANPGEIALDDPTRRATARREDHRRFSSPMVGRARERRRLRDAFEQAVGDLSCQLFTILGAAGVGKSRLVQEFLHDIEERATVARGRCLPYGDGITFWPVLEAMKDLVGGDGPATGELTQADIAGLIEGATDADLVAQRIAELIGLTESTVGAHEGFEAVRTCFEDLAASRPLVVVFDDVHWGEPTFHDLVEHLTDWSRGAPILLLCLARPELLEIRSSWGGGKLNATSVLLEPLSEAECTELVGNLLGGTDLAEEVDSRIAAAAEGNPLFVEEMLSMLIDDGVLVRKQGRWVAMRDLTEVPVPPTIQALLAARLDQLGTDERTVIEAAAVEGKVFHEGSVAQLAREVDAPSALAGLVRKELIRPERPVFAGQRAFRFRHLMIRDAAYDVLPKEARALLHEEHVGWLEQKTGAGSLEFDEIFGYHLEQAVRYRTELGRERERTLELARRAAELLGTAGRRAFLRSDGPAGLNLISRAVALLPADDALRVELVPNVRAIQGDSELTWADRVLTEAIEAAATNGDRRLAAHAIVQRGFLRLFTGTAVSAGELIDVARRAIDVFNDIDDHLGLARAWRLVAQAHYLDRSCAASAEASELALTHGRLAQDRFELREIVEWLVIAQLLGPAHAGVAIERCERLLAELAGDLYLEAQILAALAPLLAMQGRAAEADDALTRGDQVRKATGESIWIVSFWRSMVYLWSDDPDSAQRELQPSYEALKGVGEKSHFTSIAHGLADTLYKQGRYDEAAQMTQECAQACRPNDVHSHILWRSIRAKVLARRGEFDAALALAQEAVALGEESDFLPARAGAMEDRAKVLYMAGSPEEARIALERATELYEEKGNLLAADRTRGLLA